MALKKLLHHLPTYPLSGWNSEVPKRARALLELLYEVYRDESDAPIQLSTRTTSGAATSLFYDTIGTATSDSSVVINEIELYLTGSYAAHGDTPVLTWWKVCLFEILIVFTHFGAQGSCSIFSDIGSNCARHSCYSWCKHHHREAIFKLPSHDV